MTVTDFASGASMEVVRKLVGGPVRSISRMSGGRNSRVYRVDAGDRLFVLKLYPGREDDPRDRLGVEAGALRWMGEQGVAAVPRLVATDRESNSALLTWAEGSLVRDVRASDVDQAADFLRELHRLRDTATFPASHLAAEACLSGSEIERQIRARLGRLTTLEDEPALRLFLTREFSAALDDFLAAARDARGSRDLSIEAELEQQRRSLVPADFGFHNALRDEHGRLTFIDFEYFGWDDPVKLTADVMLHPGTPVAPELRHRFRSAAERLYGGDQDFATRLDAFHPLFGLRWVLILLNEFDPGRWRGRVLAGAEDNWTEAKNRQLDAARALLSTLRAQGRSE